MNTPVAVWYDINILCNSTMNVQQNLPSFSSRKQLFKALKVLVSLESSRTEHPWIHVTRLSQLFSEKYDLSLEEVAKAQGFRAGLKSLFKQSGCFSIYGNQMPQDFYVALRQLVVPGHDQRRTSTKRIRYKIKKSWKVDGNLIRLLDSEGAEEMSSSWSRRTKPRKRRRR